MLSKEMSYEDFIKDGMAHGMTAQDLHEELDRYIEEYSKPSERELDTMEVMETIDKYFKKYYPEFEDENNGKSVERAKNMIQALDDILLPLGSILKSIETPKEEKEKEKKSIEDPFDFISDILKKLN